MGIFNDRLKELKENKNIMLKDLANDLDTTSPKLSNYINGNAEPSYDFLVKIASYFDVTTDYLTGMSDYKTINEEISAKNIQMQSNTHYDFNEDKIKIINDNSVKLHDTLVKLTLLIKEDEDLEKVYDIANNWTAGFSKYVNFIESYLNDTFNLEEGRRAMVELSRSDRIANIIISDSLDKIFNEKTISDELKNRIRKTTTYYIKPAKSSEEEVSVDDNKNRKQDSNS